VLACIAAGKPCFCEKPLAETVEDCEAVLEAETKHGKRLVQLGFMRRFDAQYQAMKQTIHSGQIGARLIFQSGHRNPSVPGYYTANNALTDTAVHDIDIARYLLDDEPVAISVKAPRRNSRGGGLADPLLNGGQCADGRGLRFGRRALHGDIGGGACDRQARRCADRKAGAED
jgi:myo-inositol 2-dehydrogenase/D-chiro-inositol 1-dehydrogenase